MQNNVNDKFNEGENNNNNKGLLKWSKQLILGKLSKIDLNSQILESGWLRVPLSISKDVIGMEDRGPMTSGLL